MVKGVDEEVALLGALMIDGKQYIQAAQILQESDFYKEEHRLIWRAMTDLYNKETSIDIISVIGRLRDIKDLTRAGGASYVSELGDTLADTANIEFYAKEVKKSSSSRKLAVVGKRLQDHSVDPGERIDIAFSGLNEIAKVAINSNEARIGDIATQVYQDVLNQNGKTRGVMIGFPGIDRALDGINQDELIVLGARPSVGKSAFSLQVAWNIAKQGKRVFYVSPEMSKMQLTMRLLSMQSGVPYMAIKGARVSPTEMERVKDARDMIINLPLDIDDSPDQTIESVRLQARRMQAGNGISLLMVDYLQLLCKGDDSKEAVTVVSKGLKGIAKDLHIPVWAVTQLSRQLEYRDDKRPRLSDIRGSGQLEQDADVCMFIWNVSSAKTEVFIEKNRNGPLGATTLRFDKETTKFTLYEKE